MKKLRILYHIPSPETVYAARFIYEGYKDAFKKKGHTFNTLTSKHDLRQVMQTYKPHIFISSLNDYCLKFLDLELLKRYRKKGLVFFNQIGLWNLTIGQYAGTALKEQTHLVRLIKEGLAGDVFYGWYEKEDEAMRGFQKTTGYSFHTVLLAANTSIYRPEFDQAYSADVSYVGSYLPDKRFFIHKHVLPLMKKYNVKVYGSDWTPKDRALGYIQKVGQYFNINKLKTVRNIKLTVDEERKVYSSSTISLNIHEEHQRKNGKDFNERTFKILACKGFEICDNVKIIRKYFTDDELVIAQNTNDWFDKISYYLKYPDKRDKIIRKGWKKVLTHHTYGNRVEQLLNIYKKV